MADVPYYLDPSANAAAQPPSIDVSGGLMPQPQYVNPVEAQAAEQVAQQQAATAAAMPQSVVAQQPAPVDPMQQAMQQSQGLINQQKSINNTLGDAGVQKAQFESEKQRELAKQYETDLANQQLQAAERQKQVDHQLADINKTQSDYNQFLSSPEAKVKTNNLWEKTGTGQKILAGISLALGALGAGNTGKNGAVEIISQAIDRDVDAQKQNIALQAQGKLQNYNMSNNLYAQMLRKYQNEDQAEAAVRLLRLQQVQSQLNAVASDYQGTQVKQQAKLANVALDQAMLQQKQQFAAAAAQQAALRGLGQGLDPMNIDPATLASLPKAMQDQIGDMRERYVPGYGAAVNKQGAIEFQKVRSSAEPVLNAVDRIGKLLDDYNRVTDLKKRAQVETELKALAGALRLPITGPGALTDDEYKRLRDTIGNPSALISMPKLERAKMLQIRKKVADDLDASASQYGLPRKNKNIQLKTLDKPE